MKAVQLVCGEGYSGVERYVAALADGLVRRGFESVVIGGEPEAMTRTLAGAEVRFLAGNSMREALLNLARVGRTDILNTHMTQADIVGLASWPCSRAQVVSTLHFAHPRGRRPVVRRALRFAAAGFADQIAISDFVRRTSNEAATVILSGVPSRAPCTGDREPVVLVAQRLEHEKDTDLALRAWHASAARALGWRLAVAGRGRQEARLKELAAELGLTESVDFLGFRRDIHTLLDRSGLLLATAPAEPLGLTVLEAMAAGLPVVAAAGGGHLETVARVTGAVVFPPGDFLAAAAKIDRLAVDQLARAQYGAALQAHQQAHWTLDRQVDQTAEFYRRIVSHRRRHTARP